MTGFKERLSLGCSRSRLPEFPTISGCCCVCGGISHLPSDFPKLDDRSASADRLHMGPPHPVHRTYAAVRDTQDTHTHIQVEGKKNYNGKPEQQKSLNASISLYVSLMCCAIKQLSFNKVVQVFCSACACVRACVIVCTCSD